MCKKKLFPYCTKLILFPLIRRTAQHYSSTRDCSWRCRWIYLLFIMHKVGWLFFYQRIPFLKYNFPIWSRHWKIFLEGEDRFGFFFNFIYFAPHYPKLLYLLYAAFLLQNYLMVSMSLSRSNLGAPEILVTLFFFPSNITSCQWE